MAYTASILLFSVKIWENRDYFNWFSSSSCKTEKRCLQNLITAIQIASRYEIPKSVFLFRDTLLRRNNSKKSGMLPIILVFLHLIIPFLGKSVLKLKFRGIKFFSPKRALSTGGRAFFRYFSLEIFPGMNVNFYHSILQSQIKGIILKTFEMEILLSGLIFKLFEGTTGKKNSGYQCDTMYPWKCRAWKICL